MLYKTLLMGLLCLSILVQGDDQKEPLRLLLEKQEKSRMPLLIGIIGDDNALDKLAALFKENLERSHQFLVTIKTFSSLRTTTEISALFNEGFPLIVFLNATDKGGALEWRMYDATQVVMVKGKKYYKRDQWPVTWANNIADDVWIELLGSRGSFSTQIAYSKRVGKSSYICSSDLLGRQERLIVPSPLEQACGLGKHVRIAPCWYPDGEYPRLIFSEFTPSNVRLVMTDLHHRTRVVLDADGTHVGVSYARHGKEVVFVRSGSLWRHFFDPITNRSAYRPIIKNQGTCASPNLLENGDIIYCCKGKIYHYNAATQTQAPLIDKGYCVGPTVCEAKGLIGYSKKVGNTMQLFVYDMNQKTYRQLTYDDGDKIDPCWSPCGTWIAFCCEYQSASRIGIINIMTGVSYFITPEDVSCSYPAWSPVLSGGLG